MHGKERKTDRLHWSFAEELAQRLGQGYQRVDQMAQRVTDFGWQGIWLEPSYKHLPHMNIAIGFGVFHSCLEEPLSAIRDERSTFAQIRQNSINVEGMKDLRFNAKLRLVRYLKFQVWDIGNWSWHLDKDGGSLARKRLGFIREVVLPFVERFASLHEICQSLEKRDGWAMDLGSADTMISIAIVLNDVERLRIYRRSLTGRTRCKVFDNTLTKYITKYPQLKVIGE